MRFNNELNYVFPVINFLNFKNYLTLMLPIQIVTCCYISENTYSRLLKVGQVLIDWWCQGWFCCLLIERFDSDSAWNWKNNSELEITIYNTNKTRRNSSESKQEGWRVENRYKLKIMLFVYSADPRFKWFW